MEYRIKILKESEEFDNVLELTEQHLLGIISACKCIFGEDYSENLTIEDHDGDPIDCQELLDENDTIVCCDIDLSGLIDDGTEDWTDKIAEIVDENGGEEIYQKYNLMFISEQEEFCVQFESIKFVAGVYSVFDLLKIGHEEKYLQNFHIGDDPCDLPPQHVK